MAKTGLKAQGSAPAIGEYLTTRQVAERTGFSIKALELMRHTRRGPPYFRIGRQIRYSWADVRAWMERDRSNS